MSGSTLYDVLQVACTAEPEVIEAAYRRLAHKYHPDHNRDAVSGKRMRQINRAYDVLGNPGRRAMYDAELRRAEGQLALPTGKPPTGPPSVTETSKSHDWLRALALALFAAGLLLVYILDALR
jgi:DnaJ-class molecular chaperone